MVRVKVLLFQFKDGRALTHPLMILELREALESTVLKPEDYAGHSFRIDNHYCMWHPSGSHQNTAEKLQVSISDNANNSASPLPAVAVSWHDGLARVELN